MDEKKERKKGHCSNDMYRKTKYRSKSTEKGIILFLVFSDK